MSKLKLHRLYWLVFLWAGISLACGLAAPGAQPTNTPAGSADGGAPVLPGISPSELRGPGSFDLPDASAGLASLDGYQATLSTSFDGKVNGAAVSWSRTYTLAVEKGRGLRLLALNDSNPDPDQSLDGWITGQADGLVYTRLGSAAPCSAELVDEGNLPVVLELAQMLPPLAGAESGGSNETVAGAAAARYQFDERAVGMAGLGTASGQVWVASDGGYVLKYSLQIESDQGIFDSDQTGTMTWDYELSNLSNALDPSLPPGCPAGMADVPLPAEAAAGRRVPGYLYYQTAQPVADAAAFFQNALSAAGFQQDGEGLLNDQEARMEYVKGARRLTIQILSGDQTAVSLFMAFGATPVIEAALPTMEPGAAQALDSSKRISSSLNLIMGSSSAPGVFSSYHLEMNGTIPALKADSGTVVSTATQLSADVQGEDIHLTQTNTLAGGAAKTVEGYLIGGNNYLVTSGQVQEDLFGIQMIWLSWPLDVLVPMNTASLGSESLGTEEIDGRMADVFRIDTSIADPVSLEMMQRMFTMNPLIEEAHGTVWVDQETGGLVKLNLDYTGSFKDAAGNLAGSAPGHIEILVTGVGSVVVRLP